MPGVYSGASIFGAAAAPGRAVGQGLMQLGQGVAGALQEGERKKREKEEKNFKKSAALISMYTKMGDEIPDPAQKIKFYSGVVFPMMAKSGMLPEGVSKEEVSEALAGASLYNKESMDLFRKDLEGLSDLIDKGDLKEVTKFGNEMLADPAYSTIPALKTMVKSLVDLAKEEAKGKAGVAKEKREVTAKAKQSVAEGKTGLVAEGTPGSIEWGGLTVKAEAESGDDSKTKHTVKGFPNRTFTYKEMSTEMKNIAQNLKEQTKDNDLDFIKDVKIKYGEDGKAYLDVDAKAKTVIEKVKDYAENSPSKEVKSLAKKYMAFAETLGWFEGTAAPPAEPEAKGETPEEFIARWGGEDEEKEKEKKETKKKEKETSKGVKNVARGLRRESTKERVEESRALKDIDRKRKRRDKGVESVREGLLSEKDSKAEEKRKKKKSKVQELRDRKTERRAVRKIKEGLLSGEKEDKGTGLFRNIKGLASAKVPPNIIKKLKEDTGPLKTDEIESLPEKQRKEYLKQYPAAKKLLEI